MSNPLAELDLSKNVGGAPLGVWVVGIGGAIGFVLYRRNNSAAAVTDEAEPAPLYPGVGNGAVGGYVDNTTSAPADPGAITSNEAWGRAATNYLIAQNYDPALADSAVRKYLLSAGLSVTEYALIKVVLLKFGPPPEQLPQAPAPAPETPQAPAPPVSVPTAVTPPPVPVARDATASSGGFWYTITAPGDSLSAMAKRTYGTPDWQRIYNANRDRIRDPNVVYLGQTIWIPL